MLLGATASRNGLLRYSSVAAAWVGDLGSALVQLDQGGSGGVGLDLYSSLIRKCRDQNALAEGIRVHEHIVSAGQGGNRYLGNLLVEMYGKCGRLDLGRRVFDQLPSRNVYSWNIMVAAYAQNGDCEEAFLLFKRMQLEGVEANHVTFINVLNVCISTAALGLGRRIHALLAGSEFETNLALGTAFLTMYGKCGQLEDARRVFDALDSEKDIITWNAMVTAYAQNGQGSEALGLLRCILLGGLQPNVVTFVSLVDACSSILAPGGRKLVHGLIAEAGYEQDVVIGNCLVNMYAKCDDMQEARRVFEGMPRKDVVTWNTMIAAYAQSEEPGEALVLFRRMEPSVEPDKVMVVALLDACASTESLEQGKLVHALMIETKKLELLLDCDVIVQTALVNMYAKSGSIEDATAVFEAMKTKDVVSWNAFMSAHTGREGLAILRRMDLEGVKPTRITLTTAMEACSSSTELLPQGRQVHRRSLSAGFSRDLVICSALVSMYGKCGSLEEARTVFDGMADKNVVSWTSMIAAYVENDFAKRAVRLFWQMDLEGVKPNGFTLGRVVDACASSRDLQVGTVVQRRIRECGLHTEAALGNSIVNMFAKCGKMRESRSAFDDIECKDVVSWNSVISGMSHNDEHRSAVEVYREMLMDGSIKGDVITLLSVLDACSGMGSLRDGITVQSQATEAGYEAVDPVVVALVNMYGKCGAASLAESVFEKLQNKGDMVGWNALMSAYSHNGECHKALQAFRRSDCEGAKADEISFIAAADACGQLGAIVQGRLYHARALAAGYGPEKAPIFCNTLLNMYGRCGSLEEASNVFSWMGRWRNYVSWNTMILAYAKKGSVDGMLELFREMDLEGVEANHVSFVSILFACSHAGLLNEGRKHFQYMVADHGVEPTQDHYGCFVDLLARAGRLEEAEELLRFMPGRAGSVEWMALLGACETHQSAEYGARAAKRVMEMLTSGALSSLSLSSGPWVKISNMIAQPV